MNLKFFSCSLVLALVALQPSLFAESSATCKLLSWQGVVEQEQIVLKKNHDAKVKRYAIVGGTAVAVIALLLAQGKLEKYSNGLSVASDLSQNPDFKKCFTMPQPVSAAATLPVLPTVKPVLPAAAPASFMQSITSNILVRGVTGSVKAVYSMVSGLVGWTWTIIAIPVAVGGIKDVIAVPFLTKQVKNSAYKFGWLNSVLGITNVEKYIDIETNLWVSFDFLRGYAACLDIYSPLLDLEKQPAQDFQFLNQLAADLGKAAQAQNNPLGALFRDVVAKQRARFEVQAADLQALRNQAQLLAPRKNNIEQGTQAYSAVESDLYKQNLVMQMNLIAYDVEQVFGFILTRLANKPTMKKLIQARAEQTLVAANEYITKVNELVKLSEAELHELGKKGTGLFDTVHAYYEFIQKECKWFGHYIK